MKNNYHHLTKNGLHTWKEIVHQIKMTMEWHQEMAENDRITLQNILFILKDSEIRIEGGYELQ